MPAIWPAVPLEGEAFAQLQSLINGGGFYTDQEGEPDGGAHASSFIRAHGLQWLNALHPFASCEPGVRRTALAEACLDSMDWRTIAELLSLQADPNIRDSNGEPPLYTMLSEWSDMMRLRSVSLMLEHGANPLAEFRGITIVGMVRMFVKAGDEGEGDNPNGQYIWEAILERLPRDARMHFMYDGGDDESSCGEGSSYGDPFEMMNGND